VKNKPLPKVSKPEPLNKIDIAKPTDLVGKPTIGVDKNFVETVGLGNLKVTTVNGFKDDGNTDV
tara:strand:- start:857 stop:1048 length:192 start_codon:yes stop_codon:yes gene_type:complete